MELELFCTMVDVDHCLDDRLAVVERFHHREVRLPPLQSLCDRQQNSLPLDVGQRLAACGIGQFNSLSTTSFHPFAGNEVPECTNLPNPLRQRLGFLKSHHRNVHSLIPPSINSDLQDPLQPRVTPSSTPANLKTDSPP